MNYLYKISIEPCRGYRNYEKRKKPFYVIAMRREDASDMITRRLITGWKVGKVSKLAVECSSVLFSGTIKKDN